VTFLTPLLGVIYHRRLVFDIVYLMHAKFDDSSCSNFRDIIEGDKI